METITVYTKGVAESNPGPAGVGVYVIDVDGTSIEKVSKAIGNASTAFAQFYAVLEAMDVLKQLYAEDTQTMSFKFCLDSETVKKQLNGELPITDPGLVPMFIELHNNRVVSFPTISFIHIKDKKNKQATTLARTALGIAK
jgi:ribonuclease HI